ncbi:sugar phosphate isomerase/epimerase family protein, partial [Thermodesulfobacteriota bacterium]
MNEIGIISMQFARPFTAEHFVLFNKIKKLGFDFIELLVPEPGELNLKDTKQALDDAGLGVILAARVNLDRNIASADKNKQQCGIDYLKYAIECSAKLGSKIVGGPLTGNPLV